MSDKSKNGTNVIQLLEKEKLVSSPTAVCCVFNEYFVNIASDLGEPDSLESMACNDIFQSYQDHESVRFIKDNVNADSVFHFSSVSNDTVLKKLVGLKTNKSCGYDCMPAKLFKAGAMPLSVSLTPIINDCLIQCTFPQACKYAEVSPLFKKKKDSLSKVNYRPVSILTALSKIFEGIVCDQVMSHVENLLCTCLSAYRRKYSCNNVLLKFVEDWKQLLNENKIIGCVAMDLSKAFDSIPHCLMIAKLSAYGFS